MRENGGSRMTLCGEKMHRSRTSLETTIAAAVGDEEALSPLRRDAVEQRVGIARRARDRQRPLVDVGGEDLHARHGGAAVSMCSRSRMPIENTSSPVAQPGTQMRTVSSAPRPSNSFGITSVRQRLERVGVAEEVGDVDQQVAKQRADLLRLLAQQLDIGFDGAELAHLHAPLHPAHEGLGLVAAEIVADLVAQDGVDFRPGVGERFDLIRAVRRARGDPVEQIEAAGEFDQLGAHFVRRDGEVDEPVEMALSGMSGWRGP